MPAPNQLVGNVKVCPGGHEYAPSRPKCPACAIVASRAYYAENREHLAARQRQRRKANIEYARAFDRNRPNAEQRQEAKRVYYHEDRPKALARNKRWRQNNPEKIVFNKMIDRCTKESSSGYKNYGGRGIRVCDRWLGPDGFKNFFADLGKRPSASYSIERIEVNGNYEPSNCIWATRKEQAGNKRNSVKITFEGRTQCLAAWAVELGIRRATLHARLRIFNWDIRRAFGETRNITSPAVDDIIKSGRAGEIIAKLSSTFPLCRHKGWSARCFRCAEKAFIALVEALDGRS